MQEKRKEFLDKGAEITRRHNPVGRDSVEPVFM